MEIVVQPHGQDSGVQPVEQVGFDMLRSLFAARQSSTATVRALASARASFAPANPIVADGAPLSSLALLTGRRPTESASIGGAFADHFATVQPVAREGESHG